MKQELKKYTEYRNLPFGQKLEILKAVKNQFGFVRSINKLDRLCFEYFLKNN